MQIFRPGFLEKRVWYCIVHKVICKRGLGWSQELHGTGLCGAMQTLYPAAIVALETSVRLNGVSPSAQPSQ
jgi:hypothetical protein